MLRAPINSNKTGNDDVCLIFESSLLCKIFSSLLGTLMAWFVVLSVDCDSSGLDSDTGGMLLLSWS